MALSRKLLESLGLEADKVSTIIEAHSETVEALKTQMAQYKDEADKAKGYKEQLDTATTELDALKATGGDWQSKYEAEKKAFEDYKGTVEAKETKNAKVKAYRELLSKASISEKRIDSIMKVTNLDEIELDGEQIKGADALTEKIKEEWSDFVVSGQQNGANVDNPPRGNNEPQDLENMSMDDYIKARKTK